MVVALAVVFGMSAGVMANSLDEKGVEFEITVDKMALVETDEDSLTFKSKKVYNSILLGTS